jgi:hypothetical protein
MADSTHFGSAAVIWQGFRHLWRYNHRIPRIGSYVEHEGLSDQTCQAQIVHTASTGTGPDTATCRSYFTKVKADGVWFKSDSEDITLITQEGVATCFRREVNVRLDPELVAQGYHTVILNGFDLQTEGDPEKLNSFALRVTKMGYNKRGATLSFWITGFLLVDCGTLECDLLPVRERAHDMDSQVATLEMGPEASSADEDADPSRRADVQSLRAAFDAQCGDASLGDGTIYKLRVHYMVVAGDAEHLRVIEPDVVNNDYSWDTRNEIFDTSHGTCPVTILGVDPGQHQANVLAFKHFFTYLKRPRQINDLALHLLEWNITFRNIVAESGTLRADADLFFKNWSRGMKWTRLLWSLGALRHAGNAHVGASPTLLQFKRVHGFEASYVNHRIDWSARKGGDTSKVMVQV